MSTSTYAPVHSSNADVAPEAAGVSHSGKSSTVREMLLAYHRLQHREIDDDPKILGRLVNYGLTGGVWSGVAEAASDLCRTPAKIKQAMKAETDYARRNSTKLSIDPNMVGGSRAISGIPEVVLQCFTAPSDVGRTQFSQLRKLAERLGWEVVEANAAKHPSRGKRRSIPHVMRILSTGIDR